MTENKQENVAWNLDDSGIRDCSPEDRRYADLKRLYECCHSDPEFPERLRRDPEGMYQALHLEKDAVSPEEAVALLDELRKDSWDNPFLKLYREKLVPAEAWTAQCTSESAYASKSLYRYERLALGRLRLTNRAFEGHENIRYFPLAFELTRGCSVQCAFCGLSAERFRGIARYEDNRELWRGILRECYDLIGLSAGSGACYFATEPFDNPDYEKYMQDRLEIMHCLPQTTTAVPERDPERFRSYLRWCGDRELEQAAVRISIRSLEQMYTVYRDFTPEELMYVEVLANNPESMNAWSTSGRAMEQKGISYPISCIAGLMVSLPDRKIQFMEPVNPTKEYPTGVHIFEEKFFTDAEDFRKKAEELLNRWAIDHLTDENTVHLTPRVKLLPENEMTCIFVGRTAGMRIRTDTGLSEAVPALMSGGIKVAEAKRLALQKMPELSEPSADVRVGMILEMLFEKGYLTADPA